jgi:hypothetical protein
MSRITSFILATLLLSLTLGACMTDPQPRASDRAKINSVAELDAHLRSTPDSPLNLLAAPARQHFVNSLAFNDNGLTSFEYPPLETLTATEVYQVLGLFGVESSTSLISRAQISTDQDRAVMLRKPTGDQGMICCGPAVCCNHPSGICTGNC